VALYVFKPHGHTYTYIDAYRYLGEHVASLFVFLRKVAIHTNDYMTSQTTVPKPEQFSSCKLRNLKFRNSSQPCFVLKNRQRFVPLYHDYKFYPIVVIMIMA
jgi:hypothetical protein